MVELQGCGSAEGPTKNGLTSKVRKRARSFCIIRRCARERRNRNQNRFLYVGCKVTAAFMPIYLCFGRRPSQSESRRSATCHNKRRNAHHHKRAMASPRYSTRARVRDCAPTNNTHPTAQRRRRRRRRRARHRRFPSPRERRREQTRERKGRTRGFIDGGIAPKGAQTHCRRPTSAHKQGRRQKILIPRPEPPLR